jgi:hypothetical protein
MKKLTILRKEMKRRVRVKRMREMREYPDRAVLLRVLRRPGRVLTAR